MGRSSMNSLKLALFPLALLALISLLKQRAVAVATTIPTLHHPQPTLHLQSTTIKTIKPKTIPTLHHLLQPTPSPTTIITLSLKAKTIPTLSHLESTTIKTKTTTPLRHLLRPTPSTESRCTYYIA